MRTPSQIVGPFFAFGLCARPQHELRGGSVRVGGQPALTRLSLDPAGVEDATMVAEAEDGRDRFGVHLQGERATAFFEL